MENQKPVQKAGGTMFILFWVVVLAGLTAMFGDWEKKQYNPNASLDTADAEVTLQRNRFNHYVADGTINGQRVTFMLDTGATTVAVPAHLARKLGLRPGREYPVSTANGVVQVQDTRIDTLTLGGITLYEIRAAINPGMRDDQILLGMSALKDLEFTQSGSTLTLKQSNLQ